MDLLTDEVDIINFEDLQILKKGDEYLKLKIPHYQRPFKWGEKRIYNLINDFFDNFKKNNNSKIKLKFSNITSSNKDENLVYFAGAIVTVNHDDHLELIDGQQRLTTVFLTSYIKFLLLRIYTDYLIEKQKQSKIRTIIEELSNSYYTNIQHKKEFMTTVKNKINKFTEEIDNIDEEKISSEKKDEKKEKIYKKMQNYYRKKLGIPNISYDKKEDYYKKNKNGLLKLFGDENLSLYYNRSSLNPKLKNSLSRVWIKFSSYNNPEFIDFSNKIDDDIELRYYNAIKYIFNEFLDLANIKKESEKILLSIIIRINKFLDYLRFCIIPTGQIEDAYTLFEVLNDRALKVDDLELIKNMFYKTFYTKSKLKPEEKDDCLENLEELWGDYIFEDNIGIKEKKLISFLGTIYLTGNEKIRHKKEENYRKSIESDYLIPKYKEQNNNYTPEKIRYEFKIFQSIKILLEKYQIKFNLQRKKSLKVENDSKKSITYKTLHLLKALRLEGVIPALTNMILKKFVDENDLKIESITKEKLDNFINDFETFIKELKNDDQHENKKFEEIHELAHNLWRLSLLSKNSEKPRNKVKKIIKNINIDNYSKSENYISTKELKSAKKEFSDWTINWRYTGSKNDFKIKVLFSKLIMLNKEKNKLEITGDIDKSYKSNLSITLDHFEPNNIDQSKPEMYFTPEEDIVRDEFVNKLGNFMLLKSEDNSKKNNQPAEKSLSFYKKSINKNDHWIIEELDQILDKNHSHKKDNCRIPNKEFFNERTLKLIEEFKALLSMEINEDEIKIR